MKGSKYLAKNIGLLTVSQFGTKLLSFFLIPLYTSMLTTSEFGTYDLFNSTISLMIPILTLNICDATLRFSLDRKCNKKDIFSISMYHLIISVLISFIIISINYFFDIFPIINEFPILFVLMFIVTAFNGIMTYFARGIDSVKEVAISGIISSVVIILLTIILFIQFKLGLVGYFIANISGIFVQSLYLFYSLKGWKYFKYTQLDVTLHKKMLDYSKPLIINNISWWINNISDRYIVTWLCGVGANGIYSVSYKIPSILSVFQSIFNQAWTLSAVQDFDSEDKNNFFTNMYNSYNVCMTIICSIFIIFSKGIAKILYAKDFYSAWKYVPFLLIATVFGALSGYIGGILGAVKDTKIFAKSTSVGAIVNIILNIILVGRIGVIGAAIATVISYFVTWVIRFISVKKYIRMNIRIFRDSIAYFILFIQSILLYSVQDIIIFFILETLFFMMILIIHHSTLHNIYIKLQKSRREK